MVFVHVDGRWERCSPVPITKDDELDCFLFVRVEVSMLNLCTTITELSPNDHEVVESNNISPSPWVGGYFVQESISTTEENNGAIVLYQGANEPHSTCQKRSRDVPISYIDKEKQKVVDEVGGTSNVPLNLVDIDVEWESVEISPPY
ncbi:unnamed protein product [Cochlearia groenlandica]